MQPADMLDLLHSSFGTTTGPRAPARAFGAHDCPYAGSGPFQVSRLTASLAGCLVRVGHRILTTVPLATEESPL